MEKQFSRILHSKEDQKSRGLKGLISRLTGRRKPTEREGVLPELMMFSLGFLLSRCHLIFGAHPLATAFLCALPSYLWPTLFGSVVGAFSMGIDGIIFAISSAIAVFLRVAVSSGDKECENVKSLFREALPLRLSVGIICGFVSALYQVLISNFSRGSLLFGISMITLTPVLTFIFSGLFCREVNLKELLSEGSIELFEVERSKSEKYNLAFFYISALTLLFFIGLAFRGVDILGISLSYIFSGLVTLLAAKKLGPLAAMAVGFSTSLGISGTLSVAFALAGFGAGILMSTGVFYAIVLGGVILGAWSSYAAGLGGLLSTLPEYIIAATIGAPLLKSIKVGQSENDKRNSSAEDMVGTMALAYRSGYSGVADKTPSALRAMSDAISSFAPTPGELTPEDYRKIVIKVAQSYCIGCEGVGFCAGEGIRPCIKNAENIAYVLSKKGKITPDQVNTQSEFCSMATAIAESINREAVRAEMENLRARELGRSGEEYRLAAAIMSNAIGSDDREQMIDNSLTPQLTQVIRDCGIEEGMVRAYGRRKKYILLAAEDENGTKINSPELISRLEEVVRTKLKAPNLYRKDKMLLMECSAKRSIAIKSAMASCQGHEKEASGDSALTFTSSGDMFYSLISDGMGSGEDAKKASGFVADLVKAAMEGEADKDSVLHIINRAIKMKGEECSATVDLLELDLLNGSGVFLKCGASPSYIKRDSSIFRIRSQTAPIGLMNSIDAEKTKLEIRPGDHIFMFSDGIADERDHAAWLLLLLGEKPKNDLTEYANLILEEAKKHSKTSDDMTVIILRADEV